MIEYTQAEVLRFNACHALQSALDELRGKYGERNTDFCKAGNYCAEAARLIDELEHHLASEASSKGGVQ